MAIASDKIEELVKANQVLSNKKDKAAAITNKTKAQYARQMAKLHKRINDLEELCESNGINHDP